MSRTLTKRQMEVATLVRQGMTNGEIAWELGITIETAKNHMTAIMKRLGVESRTGVAAWMADKEGFKRGLTWCRKSLRAEDV